MAMEGIAINARPTSPSVIKGPAPGQCIILNKDPITNKELHTVPEIKANLFILMCFIFSYSSGFSVLPRFYSGI
jgi:hypothetical protein